MGAAQFERVAQYYGNPELLLISGPPSSPHSPVHLLNKQIGPQLIKRPSKAASTHSRHIFYKYLAPTIQLLESPIPTIPTPTPTSQKALSGDISGTKRGIIDPLVL